MKDEKPTVRRGKPDVGDQEKNVTARRAGEQIQSV
jgi:hypothetical protein